MNSPPPAKVLPGTVFAGYRIERVLGSGGMGTVYVAVHPRLPRRDALKVLAPQYSADPEFRARFIREAELAGRLDHPNIIGVYDRGIEEERLWIAMRFMDCSDAAALVRNRTEALSLERVLHIVDSVARGLDHAHRAGILHRDVKPANILVETIPGQPDRVAITDFGIAKAAAATALTETGSVLATIAYAAPEQLTGAAIDHRADVYSLGCTLYELLTGAKPFPRATTAAVMMAHLHEPPPRASQAIPELPSSIDDVIARALAKDPLQRYPTCEALAAAAQSALGVPLEPGATKDPRQARRNRTVVAIAAATTVAVLAVASIAALQRNSADNAVVEGSSGSTSTTEVVDSSSWAAHQRVVDLFPNLLPKTQTDSGYQGLRCVAVDVSLRPVDVRQTPLSMNALTCNGNRNPTSQLLVRCGIDARAIEFDANPNSISVGEEEWTSAAGHGHITWYDGSIDAGPRGELVLRFDDAPRTNCTMKVFGGTSGQDLYDRWWRDAPI